MEHEMIDEYNNVGEKIFQKEEVSDAKFSLEEFHII